MENKKTIGEYIDSDGFYSIQAYESFNNGEKYFEFYFKTQKSNDLYLGIENHNISGLIFLFKLLAKAESNYSVCLAKFEGKKYLCFLGVGEGGSALLIDDEINVEILNKEKCCLWEFGLEYLFHGEEIDDIQLSKFLNCEDFRFILSKIDKNYNKNDYNDEDEEGLTFVDVVVRVCDFRHRALGHHVEEFQAKVGILTPTGLVIYKTIRVAYCEECNVYFIKETDFEHLKSLGVLLCKVITEKVFESRNKRNSYALENGLSEESILHIYGYNVSSNSKLTAKQRQIILSHLVDEKIVSVTDIVNYLDWFIESNQHKARYAKAIQKWIADRQYILNYELGSLPKIKIRSIKHKSSLDDE